MPVAIDTMDEHRRVHQTRSDSWLLIYMHRNTFTPQLSHLPYAPTTCSIKCHTQNKTRRLYATSHLYHKIRNIISHTSISCNHIYLSSFCTLTWRPNSGEAVSRTLLWILKLDTSVLSPVDTSRLACNAYRQMSMHAQPWASINAWTLYAIFP